ncbi:MAG: hypothetical protein ACXV9P_13090 [Acidimicrobiia bacterium]
MNGTFDHLVPFQDSTSDLVAVERVTMKPTARQRVGVTHETADSVPPLGPAGVGLGVIDHSVPFQCSIRVLVLSGPPLEFPVAKQSELLVHEMLPRP